MKRKELLNKMIKCYTTCRNDLNYDVDTSLNRVLEIVEEELNIKFDNGGGGISQDPDYDDDNYCGAV